MKLFDSHCHLDDKSYDKDRNEVIKRAKEAGVMAAMIVGVSQQSSAVAVELAESHHGLYASVGIHPHEAKECSQAMLDFLVHLSKSPKVKAWGEIGLDFNRMYSPRQDQEKWFIKQLETAETLNLPLIFHERDSNGRFLELLKAHRNKLRGGVVHCFSGNKAEMAAYIDLGLYIGITGIVTIHKRGASLRKLIPLIPADRILVETDAPYLTPAPEKNRTRRNEPAFVKSTLLKIAEILDDDPEHLATLTWENTCRLFGIDDPLNESTSQRSRFTAER